MTTIPKITWSGDTARRLQEQSQQRIDAARPLPFEWRAIEADSTLQQTVLRLHLLSGSAVEDEDLVALIDTLAAREATFLTVFEDFVAIAEVAKCPICGDHPVGRCRHTDETASFVPRDGPGGIIGDPSARNRVLRDHLRAAGTARRSELALTRAQRISDKKAQIIAAMRQQVEEATSS